MVLASILGELLNPLVEFLKCLALWFLGALEWLFITFANLLLKALMVLVSVLALLPEVNLEHLSLPPFLALVNYILPMTYFITLVLLTLTVELVLWGVNIALRWIRARGN
jgi:hypothetical protein